jgi:RHS repeat-associated protein
MLKVAFSKTLVSSPVLFAANDNLPCRLVCDSNLTSKADASASYLYTYDQSGNLIEESKGGVVTDYIYVDGINIANWEPSVSHLFNIFTDARGVPIIGRDKYGTTNWAAYTEPYGTLTVTVNSSPYTCPITQNLRLPGQYDDYEVNTLSYNMQRDYLNTLGRYIESDPIGLTGGLNTYGYAQQNPLLYVDPDGQASSGLSPKKLPPRQCNSQEYAQCSQTCGSKGVESCMVPQTKRLTSINNANGFKGLIQTVDGPVSCSCNDPEDDGGGNICTRNPKTCSAALVISGVAICIATGGSAAPALAR